MNYFSLALPLLLALVGVVGVGLKYRRRAKSLKNGGPYHQARVGKRRQTNS